jgi:hypothetical protein
MSQLTRCVLVVCLLSTASRAEVPISFYGDVDFKVNKEGGVTNTFAVPRLEIFATHTIERVTFLTEIMFEVSSETNAFALDIERVEVGYQVTGWLRVRAGRFHTALGYYNDAIHHGAYFMVPVYRPSIVDFEDGGGLIPAHAVGLHADGHFELGQAARLRFDIDLANGRQGTLTDIANLFDINQGKAFNVRVRLEPLGAAEGLIIGANFMVDRLSLTGLDPASTDPTAKTWGLEQIFGAHVAYFEHNLHLIVEGYAFHHLLDANRFDGWTLAGMAEVGYVINEFTPFVRGEVAHFPAAGDPVFAEQSARGDRLGLAAGVRWMISENLAFKAQGEWFHHGAVGSNDRLTGTLQLAFAF